MGIEINPKLVPEDGWASTLNALFSLVEGHPGTALLLFLGFIVVLLLLPGGTLPSYLRYRGASKVVDDEVDRDKRVLFDNVQKRIKAPLNVRQPSRKRRGRGGRR